MTPDVDLGAFVGGFVAEAEEHLRTCRAALVELDRASDEGAPRPRALRELYRALHTLKGLSAMVGVDPLVDLTHRLEAVLRDAEEVGGAFSASSVDALVRGLAAIEQRVRLVSRGEPVTPVPAALLRELEELRSVPAVGTAFKGMRLRLDASLAAKLGAAERIQLVDGVRAGRRAVRLTFVPTPARAGAGLRITTVRERIAALGDLVRVMPLSIERSDAAPGGLAFLLLVLTDATDDELAEAAGLDDPSAIDPLVEVVEEPVEEEDVLRVDQRADSAVVRVAVDRLERTFTQLSTVIVTRHRLERAIDALAERGVDVRELRQTADEHGRQVRDLRESVLQLRMIPVAEMLEPIPLIVRGLRSTTGKVTRVQLEVAHAELDKAVAEALFPAIVHLVRNAVDHGIEAPERRRELGKPEVGTITIRAAELGTGMLELTVSDDGAGVDAAALAQRAGAPLPENDAELLSLLVRAGISSRAEVDHTSGRGLGMEIVHRVVVQQLGGELHLVSRPGRGTTFVLGVPLTVNLVDGLSFMCGSQPFVAPLSSIEEVLDLADEPLVTAPDPRGVGAARLLQHHGEVIPFVPLGPLFGIGGSDGTRRGVLVRRGGHGVAFGVDRVLGLQELVVRPLEDPLVRVVGVAGSTDLGDGRATLVLDLPLLASRVAADRAKETAS